MEATRSSGASGELEYLPGTAALTPPEVELVDGTNRVIPTGQRGWGLAPEFTVAPTQQGKGVVVATHPNMGTSGFAAAVELGVASAGSLAPQTPANLVDGDLKSLLPARRLGQGIGRTQTGIAPP